MGSNITINCLSTLGCPWAKFQILLNYSSSEAPPRPVNSSTVQLRLRDFRMPSGAIVCLARCPNNRKDRLVCGTDVLAGCEYPTMATGFWGILSSHQHRRRSGQGAAAAWVWHCWGGDCRLCLTFPLQTLQTPPAT